MSDFKRALEEHQRQTATRLLEILRDTPFPEEGVDSGVFANMIRLFMACGIDKEDFALKMGVSPSTIDRWAINNPPKRFAQKAVVDWIKQYLLDQHMAA